MRILLDESVHRGVREFLPEHDVAAVQEVGWSQIANGELLGRASEQFDVLVTCDQGIPHQQNLSSFSIAIVVLAAPSNRIEDLRPLAAELRRGVGEATPGSALVVTA